MNLVSSEMEITFDEKKLSLESIKEKVESLGYKAAWKNDSPLEKTAEPSASKRERLFLYLSIFLTALLFFVGMLQMMHIVRLPYINEENPLALAVFELLLAAPVVLMNAFVIKDGMLSLARFSPNMHSLLALSVTAAFSHSLFTLFLIVKATVQNENMPPNFSHNLHFDSTAMILTFVSIGEEMLSKTKRQTRKSLEELASIFPQTSLVIRDGKEMEVASKEIRKSDTLILRAGETAAVDGVVIEGEGDFDVSFVTGESLPVSRVVGDEIVSASVSLSGSVKIRPVKTGEETTFAKILLLVARASSSKPKTASFADTLALRFIPALIFVALLTFFVHLRSDGFSSSLSFAISVLLVACPCALGLAVPAAVSSAVGRAAQKGIFIKDAAALEKFARVKSAVFDKTGTLTSGEFSLSLFIPPSSPLNENEAFSLAAAAESSSTHPIAKAILREAEKRGSPSLRVRSSRVLPAKGAQAFLEEGTEEAKKYGSEILIGNERLLPPSSPFFSFQEGQTRAFLILKGEVCAVFSAGDSLKKDAEVSLKELAKLGIKTYMLTGDNEEVAQKISSLLPLEGYKASLLPEEKLEECRRIKTQNGGLLAYAGDGVNDAPALAVSDVAISMEGASQAASENADVILTGSSLMKVVYLRKLSTKTMRIIKENLFWAFFYNALTIPVAAGVFSSFGIQMRPELSALAMSLSSVSVMANALRLKSFHL